MSSKTSRRLIEQVCNNQHQKITLSIQIGTKRCRYALSHIKIDVKDGVQLRLYKNLITAIGVKILKDSNINLSFLSISNNMIGDKGCRYIANANWPLLRVLYIKQNSISDCGLRYLKRGSWSNLKQLGISKNVFGAEGCISLTKGNWKLSQLQFSYLFDIQNHISNLEQIQSLCLYSVIGFSRLYLQVSFVQTDNSEHEIEVIILKHPKLVL